MTVKDAQELAPEFAKQPEASETRREAELVISPNAVEDVWQRGHPRQEIMDVREHYFWLVNLLKSNPTDDYLKFDPEHLPQEHPDQNKNNVQWELRECDQYRSSTAMVRQGIAILNKYYYDWMQGKYTETKPTATDELKLMVRVIECFGGVFGFMPMEPYIQEHMRQVYLHRVNEKNRRERECI